MEDKEKKNLKATFTKSDFEDFGLNGGRISRKFEYTRW